MLRDKVRAGGLCSVILGIILTTYVGYRIGNRIDWAVKYMYGLYSTPYRYVMGETNESKQVINSEDQAEIKYVRDSGYIGLVGGGLFVAGALVLLVTRERIGAAPIIDTKYESLRPKPPKGSKERPYKI